MLLVYVSFKCVYVENNFIPCSLTESTSDPTNNKHKSVPITVYHHPTQVWMNGAFTTLTVATVWRNCSVWVIATKRKLSSAKTESYLALDTNSSGYSSKLNGVEVRVSQEGRSKWKRWPATWDSNWGPLQGRRKAVHSKGYPQKYGNPFYDQRKHSSQSANIVVVFKHHHMSLMDFVVSPPGCGRSVTDFWGWDAHQAQLRCPDEVEGDIWIWSTRRSLKPKFYQLPKP
jgi:hypothetical protein